MAVFQYNEMDCSGDAPYQMYLGNNNIIIHFTSLIINLINNIWLCRMWRYITRV